MIREGSLLAASPKCASTFLQRRWMGDGKKTRRCRWQSVPTAVLYLSCSCLRHKQVWQLPKHSPEPRYSLTRCSSKANPEFYLFPTQFPLPQPAITPQSQSTSLHTQLPPEGRSSSLTCMLTLQKRDINFHFSPEDTTFSLNYWMLQWLHLKSWAFSSILLPRVMQSLSFQITQCICNQAVSWL